MKSKVKKFSVSMPIEAYELYQQKAQASQLSISQMLYRAGSIVSVQELVMFPLQDTSGAAVKK